MATKGERPEASSGVLLTLQRGLSALEAIGASDATMTAKELAQSAGVNIGTCYQILRTLTESGYVSRLANGRYRLGPQIGRLYDDLQRQTAGPADLLAVLERLHQTTQETVYMSLRERNDIVVVAHFEGTKPIRVGNISVGLRGSHHARASSKSVLAQLDPDLGGYLTGTTFPAITPNTITDLNALRADFAHIRERGYALDTEEFREDVGCVGAAFLDADGVAHGSYTVSVLASRLAEREDELAAAVVAAADEATQLLAAAGTRGPVAAPARSS